MATNMTEDNPYPNIRWNMMLCLTAKEMVRTFKMRFAIITSTKFPNKSSWLDILKQSKCNTLVIRYITNVILSSTNGLYYIVNKGRTLHHCIGMTHEIIW